MMDTERKASDDGLMRNIFQRPYKELSLLPVFEFIRILELVLLLNLPLLLHTVVISATPVFITLKPFIVPITFEGYAIRFPFIS